MKTQENQSVGYICEMANELAKIARADGLELLAHLLEMARLEAENPSKNGHDKRSKRFRAAGANVPP